MLQVDPDIRKELRFHVELPNDDESDCYGCTDCGVLLLVRCIKGGG